MSNKIAENDYYLNKWITQKFAESDVPALLKSRGYEPTHSAVYRSRPKAVEMVTISRAMGVPAVYAHFLGKFIVYALKLIPEPDLSSGEVSYDRICKKCGKIFDAFNIETYDGDEGCTDPYIICRDCNDEFWGKWYNLPKVQYADGKFMRTEAHDALIKGYFKETYFDK